ncbi:hypothetical protein [Paenibacillus taichungensis]
MSNSDRVQELSDKTVDLAEAVQSGDEGRVSVIVEECQSILNAIEESA